MIVTSKAKKIQKKIRQRIGVHIPLITIRRYWSETKDGGCICPRSKINSNHRISGIVINSRVGKSTSIDEDTILFNCNIGDAYSVFANSNLINVTVRHQERSFFLLYNTTINNVVIEISNKCIRMEDCIIEDFYKWSKKIKLYGTRPIVLNRINESDFSLIHLEFGEFNKYLPILDFKGLKKEIPFDISIVAPNRILIGNKIYSIDWWKTNYKLLLDELNLTSIQNCDKLYHLIFKELELLNNYYIENKYMQYLNEE